MKKLYTKIFHRFALVTILIVLFTDICFLLYFIRTSHKNAQITLDSYVRYSGEVLEKLSEETALINTLIQKDSDVQAALRDIPETNNDTYSQKLEINGYLYTLQENNTSYVDSFYVLLDDGRQFKSTNFPLLYDNSKEIPEFSELREYTEEEWLPTYAHSLAANNYKKGYVAVCYPLWNVKTGKSVGVVVEEILTQSIEESLVAAGYLESVSAQISDRDGNVLLSAGDGRIQGHKIESTENLLNGWELRFACGMWSMVGNTMKMALLLGGLLTVFMILVSVYLSRKIAGSVSEPINRLLNIMTNEELMHHEKQAAIATDIYEVTHLFQKYEQMIERLQTLFSELEQKQQALRKSEYEALQAQINPHFLYNTLDNITWKIRTGNEQDAIEEVVSLSRFFRLSLSKGADMVSVKNEMEHVRLYLKLQKKRYGERFDFEMESYIRLADMERIRVPKLILQPLAENAIYHGFEQMKNGGVIHILADYKKGEVFFEVCDNGKGIECSLLDKINKKLSSGEVISQLDSPDGYGIYNINARIKSLFGQRYGLTLQVRKGGGVCARLTMPYEVQTEQSQKNISCS